ncbi:hypothetical protein HIM_03648 [Hirsutella minnesotensis 3608]|uniref:Uncharacterized protein n=1 Tax=Hirsutella minnesotensis 3608 TaxID=1043627 RepID=A0A0F7ZLX7_9HYPO|nr:hypothetical protein HIM_03648 [Hirsutella minnesotensis 3608]
MQLDVNSTYHRTVHDEPADMQQTEDNLRKESWKDWPNSAGFVGLKEHRGPLSLQVKGTIPAWAEGTLYRTGPGSNVVENTSRGTHYVSHWFDGFAHSHKFDIIPSSEAGGATTVNYSSRRQSDELVESIRKKGWLTGVSFAQRSDPCLGIFAKATSVFQPAPVNVNVAIHRDFPGVGSGRSESSGHRASNLVLTSDHFNMQSLDPDTLEPLASPNQTTLHPDLKGPLSCAHPQRDPKNGDMFNVNLQLGPSPTYRFFRVDASTGETTIIATLSEPGACPAYIHSMFLTENYLVFCIPSSHLAWKGAKILWERNILEAIKPFDKGNLCRWFVIDRRGGKGVVARFSTPASFFFHSVNAFEEYEYGNNNEQKTTIYLDYVGFQTTDIMLGLYYDVLLDRNDATKKYWIEGDGYKNLNPSLVRYRFTLPPPSKKQTRREAAHATGEQVFSIPNPHAGELPTINPGYACRPYRYVYATCNRGVSNIADSLVRTDVQTREALIWCGPHSHCPGEPVFLPRPGATDEDDGVVLSVVLDGAAETSYLLCLDARTMTETGRAEADFAIAVGLHGIHTSSVDKCE